MLLPTLATCPVNNRRVFVRADLNVPFGPNGSIRDDYRLQAICPTLDYLLAHHATVVLATHVGNPAPGVIRPELSTELLVPWLRKRGYPAAHSQTLASAHQLEQQKQTFILLENVRFLAGEKEGSIALAREYAQLAEVFVNDAFATCHRPDTSITLLATLFSPENRCIGLRLQQELAALDRLKTNPLPPFVLVLGGSKWADKIPLIQAFLKAKKPPQAIIVGGALALPFLKAQEHPVGTTVIDTATLKTATAILHNAAGNNIELLVPRDAVVTNEISGTLRTVPVGQIPADGQCVDIGPETVTAFTRTIATAHTIFANGTMGIYENPASAAGTTAILTAIAGNAGYTVIGGGDCTAAAHHLGLAGKIGFISTGGGATLAYLSSANPLHDLPGLQVIAGK